MLHCIHIELKIKANVKNGTGNDELYWKHNDIRTQAEVTASDINKLRNQTEDILMGVRDGCHVRLTTSSLSVNQMSIKCGSLDIPQSHGPP
jgi:hypothetical protein